MKAALLILAGLLSTEALSLTTDLSIDSHAHQLVDAEFIMIPTRTEIKPIPGCVPNTEASADCTEVVVIEEREAIRANVSYQGSQNPVTEGEGQEVLWISFDFEVTQFDPGEVEMLKKAHPRFRHPFASAFTKFAERNLELSVITENRPVKVVDMARSTICRARQDGTKPVNCKEKLVYMTKETKVKKVSVVVK